MRQVFFFVAFILFSLSRLSSSVFRFGLVCCVYALLFRFDVFGLASLLICVCFAMNSADRRSCSILVLVYLTRMAGAFCSQIQ